MCVALLYQNRREMLYRVHSVASKVNLVSKARLAFEVRSASEVRLMSKYVIEK